MSTALSHENLDVYRHSLAFCAVAQRWSADWEPKHAIADHLPRAAESVVESIAVASAAHSDTRQATLDYALGSTLECAASVDIATVKALLAGHVSLEHKTELAQVFRMLMGLRRAWSRSSVREDAAPYETRPPAEAPILFHHERLDVYRVALDALRSVYTSDVFDALPVSTFRRLDCLGTSMLLNIAEGNGRFSETDHCRFMNIAHGAAIKLCAQFDICVAKQVLPSADVARWKQDLTRVASMTAGMMRELKK